ncbi:MAG: PcfJ domain-containing protein [Oscillospiraceae bacterium]|nr:PcfJ domain-containing protein [Oscillospiraceae bacterium]
MNKKECRKFGNPGLRFNSGNGLLLLGQMNHIVRTTVKNIAGQRVLIVYFYNREKISKGYVEPEYMLFQGRDDYITLQYTDDGKEKWREASLDNLGERYAYFTKKCVFYRKRDEQVVTRFCRHTLLSGFDALNDLQEKIMNARLTERIKARERKIIERMKPVAPVPRGLKSWVHREILPHYIFYEYKGGKKPMKGYCTACRHDVLVSGAKHCLGGKCPRCGKKITFKASGKSQRVWNRATVQVLHKINGNELVLRIFKVVKLLRNWREPYFSVYENARIFIRYNEGKQVSIEQYYYSYNICYFTKWKKGERPRFSNYQYSFEGDTCGYLYCEKLESVLKDTPWQYSQLERFYRIDREALEIIPFLYAYLRYPAIEYLIKLGLTKLAAQIIYDYSGRNVINESGKNLRETLGVGPEDLPVLQKINVNTRQLELFQELKKQGVRADETLLIWYQERSITAKDNILIPLRYSTPKKIMCYVDEQYVRLKDKETPYGVWRYEKPKGVLSEYKDYLVMGGHLEYDFSDSFALFPKNLPEAHDQASKLYDVKKKAGYDQVIREAYKNLAEKYRMTKNGLTIIPPKTAKEIVTEGHTLHHCVHTYVERVADGKCVILFIRKTANIKEPFYTLEVRDGQIVQIHGDHHGAPTPEVKKFLELWERKKLQPMRILKTA